MRRIVALILLICVSLLFCGCTKEKTSTVDYQYMYDGIVEDWNNQAAHDSKRESLFGFGSYLYNSYLVLFPRETPSTLKEYYFHWTPGIDVDGYAIYFTCELEENGYDSFVNGLNNFEISSKTGTVKLLYDTEHFDFPSYILQWKEAGEKWEVLEYIMLDEKNHIVIFVYTMSELEHIEENSSYNVTPSELHFLDNDFSIYDDFENSTFYVSFLAHLM